MSIIINSNPIPTVCSIDHTHLSHIHPINAHTNNNHPQPHPPHPPEPSQLLTPKSPSNNVAPLPQPLPNKRTDAIIPSREPGTEAHPPENLETHREWPSACRRSGAPIFCKNMCRLCFTTDDGGGKEGGGTEMGFYGGFFWGLA